jgi:hypothetical protein
LIGELRDARAQMDEDIKNIKRKRTLLMRARELPKKLLRKWWEGG